MGEQGFVGKSEQKLDPWLGDSGASHHIKSSSAGMIDVTKCPPGTKIKKFQESVDVKEWGTLLLQVDGEKEKRVMKLEHTLIVPNISVNIFFLQQVLIKGYILVYGEVEGKCIIKKKSDNGDMIQVATMSMKNGRATLDCKLRSSAADRCIQGAARHETSPSTTRTLQQRRHEKIAEWILGSGHRQREDQRYKRMRILQVGKTVAGPHPSAVVNYKVTEFLDLVVVDLAGPKRPQNLGGKVYDMVIIDTYLERIFVKLLAKKSNAANVLMRWIVHVEVQTGKKLKRLRSDNGG